MHGDNVGVAQEFQKSAEYKKYLAVAKPKAKAAGRKWMEMAGMSIIEVAPWESAVAKRGPYGDWMPKTKYS